MASSRSRLCLSFLVAVLISPRPTAQAPDVKAVLQAVAANIGATDLRCVTYSGNGWVGAVGQNFTPRDDWPRTCLQPGKRARRPPRAGSPSILRRLASVARSMRWLQAA